MESRATTTKKQKKKSEDMIASLYHYSDLSVQAIADKVNMNPNEVQKIIDDIVKSNALEVLVEQSTTRVEKIMTSIVIALDYSKTAVDAAVLMTEKQVGSVVVTKDNGKPFGIVTERDLVRRIGAKDLYFHDGLLGHIASSPLIYAEAGLTVQEAAEIMIKNRIRRLPIVHTHKLAGIVTVTDLAVFLSPTRRPGLALSVLQAISRNRNTIRSLG
jgi:CBS domain-containing protein